MKTTRISATIFSFFIILSITLSGSVWGQVVIAVQDFESVPANPTLSFTNTGGGYSTGTNGSGVPANANLFVSGSRGWQSNNANSTVTFANQILNAYSNTYIEFRLAGMSVNGTNGIDGTDIVTVSISVDGGTTYSSELTIAGSTSNQRWDFSATGSSTITYDGNNSPTAVTSSTGSLGVSTIIINIPNSISQVCLRISMLNNDANERWVIDDVRIRGTANVSFNSNGGTGTMANQTASTSTALNSNTFTRSGYTFTGWNTAADGSGTPYANGASYPFTSSVTLFAQWCQNNTWLGSSTGNWSTASNWCGGAPTSSSNITIANGTTVTLDNTSETIINDLTINGTLILAANSKLTVNGVLTNNGTITIESGATLVQGQSSTNAGSGTYQVKQTLNTAGRFWYLGVPLGSLTESNYLSNLTNGETLKKRDETSNQWTTVTANSSIIPAGRGYFVQNPNSTPTILFQGTGAGFAFNNGAITISGLTRTAGQAFEGFNLVSNPYPSYLNWDLVSPTNVDGTIWYRTFNSTSNSMVFDTYVANAAGGIGTNLSGNTATKYIPPMQSFWVRVTQGQTSGSLALDNSMRSHFASLGNSTAGLRSTNDELKLFLRMNLLQDNKKDQIIVYVNDNANNGFDQFDGEKMMQAGLPQFYTSAAGKKITINGLNSAKKQQKLPITIELPTTGVHSFIIEDLEIDNGLVWLEDKQEEIMQALEPGTVYEFYANSGVNAERFVLHFQLLDTPTPTNNYNEVGSYANFNGKGASVLAEAAGVVVIKLPASTEGITDIQIRDAAGRLVYTGSTNTLETSVQLEQANGIYYVTLNGTSGVEVRKVFIQQ